MTDREQEQLLATATDRFERRLSEEAGAIRVTMVERDAALRQDIADLRVDISAMRLEITGRDDATRLAMTEGDNATRLAMTEGDNALRLAMTEGDNATRLEIARLRLDMSGQFAETRVHAEARHRELLKWALMFWIAQAAATAGIVSALA